MLEFKRDRDPGGLFLTPIGMSCICLVKFFHKQKVERSNAR